MVVILYKKEVRNHIVQEIFSNYDVTIQVDIRVQSVLKIEACKLRILVIDKKRKKNIITEVEITDQAQLIIGKQRIKET